MKPNITWKDLYGTDNMEDMRDMIAPINRLINKLEESKKVQVNKPMLEVNHELVKAQNDAQSHWRGIREMISYQKEQ